MSWTKERYQRLLVAIYDTTPKLDWDGIFEQMNDGTKVETTKAHIRGLRRVNRASTPKSPGRTKRKAARSTPNNKAKDSQSEGSLEPKMDHDDGDKADLKEKIEDSAAEAVSIKSENVEDIVCVMQDPEEV